MAIERKQRERGDVIFANQLVTMADLENFKSDILDEIRKIVKVDHGIPTKKWLKSSEVRKLLDISPGKLHWLRSNRQLEFIRIGGAIYYDREDITKMFEKSKVRVLS